MLCFQPLVASQADAKPSSHSPDLFSRSLPTSAHSMSPPPSLAPLAPLRVQPSTPSKRPKLALQISQTETRFVAKSTTALALSTNPTSPTSRNTFSNAYDAPLSAIASPVSIGSTCFSPRSPSDELLSPGGSTRRTSFSSVNSGADFSFSQPFPYKNPQGLRSILRSSQRSRRPVFASRISKQIIFPSTKKVTYSTVIAEEITTTKYTKSHYELLCEDEQPDTVKLATPASALRGSLNTNLPTSPQSTEDLTPAARKRKKREWRWTIGTDRLEDENEDEVTDNDTLETDKNAGHSEIIQQIQS